MDNKSMSASDFQVKAIIGHGHFGIVQVVKHKKTDEVYAMKVLQKSDILSQPDISSYQEERNIMAETTSSWITRLHFAFQDSVNLYLAMEFHAGGDLLSLLSRHDDIFDEEMAKFYIAEMTIAINSLHDIGYLHRDIKPENILLDRTGHVKLADFGSAALMNSSKKVSSRMPVGTPDYIAPELLTSLNKAQDHTVYGPEVDWWSLGVCAYEMLYGGTPFTNEHASMVSTYANIMDYKNTLKFPTLSNASSKAKDLIKKLLTDATLRFGWKEIRRHPFFYKLQWDTMRDREAVYVPTLNSLDDTSHFDDVEKVERQPNLNLLKTPHDVKEQDKKFKDFNFVRDAKALDRVDEVCLSAGERKSTAEAAPMSVSARPSLAEGDFNNSNMLNTAVCLDRSRTSSNSSLNSLHANDNLMLHNIDSLKLHDADAMTVHDSDNVHTVIEGKDQKILELCMKLKQQREEFERIDDESCNSFTRLMASKEELAKEDAAIYEAKMEELMGQVVTQQTEQDKMMLQLMNRDRKIDKLKAQLEEAQRMAQAQRVHYDAHRRESRDDTRKDLELLEQRNDIWHSLMDDKQAMIEELNERLHEAQTLVEAYQDSEEQQCNKVTEIQHKLDTTMQDISSSGGVSVTDVRLSTGGQGQATVELSDHHSAVCPSKKKVTLHVTLKAGRCSFDNSQTVKQLKDLQQTVDKYTERAKEWREVEEELRSRISGLEEDNVVLRQREGMTRKMKEDLWNKVTSYQKEVGAQKSIIRELQETLKGYLERSASMSGTESQLKESQARQLGLETELQQVKEDARRTRQAALDKTNEMEDAIGKLEETRAMADDYRKKYTCQVEVTEVKVSSLEEQLAKVTADRQRLERREGTLTTQMETLRGLVDDAGVEKERLERRITDLQSHLQQLQQRNSELSVEMESLQKSNAKNDADKLSKAELTFQLNRAQTSNADLERRVTQSLRDKQSAEDKVSLIEREKERMNRRIERLEVIEKEKRDLEMKVEKVATLERENRRMEVKVDRLSSVEKEKLNLEEKIEKLELELRREKVNVEALGEEKVEAKSKLAELRREQGEGRSTEVAQLKMKLTLMESVEREKGRLECLVEKMDREKDVVAEENRELEREKDKMKVEMTGLKTELVKLGADRERLRGDMSTLQQAKSGAEHQLGTLGKEKQALDEQVTKLKREMDRLESSVSQLHPTSSQGSSEVILDVHQLTSEVNRLKALVDKIEQERSGKVTKEAGIRTSSSGLVEKLQREKAELQRKVEGMERQSPQARRMSGWRGAGTLDRADKTKLEAEIKDLNNQVKKLESEVQANNQAAIDLRAMKQQHQTLEEASKGDKFKVTEALKATRELKDRLEVQTANVAELRAQVEEQMKMETDLVTQLEKEATKAAGLREEKDKLEIKLQTSTSGPRRSGESQFEKRQLEVKVQELTEERDRLQCQLQSTPHQPSHSISPDSTEDMEQLKQELDAVKRELAIRKGAAEKFSGDIPAYLRAELQESNLALSEARSLLAAQRRQELELRDRLDKLQRIIDNKAVENAQYLQNSQDAISELKNMKSQRDTLQRQCKNLEEKYSSMQREKGGNSQDTMRAMEEMTHRQTQLDMEGKKVAKLSQVIEQQEHLIKDLEAKEAEGRRRQTEWDRIRKSYESASHKSAASSSEVSSLQNQVESLRAFHQGEVETLQHNLREEAGHVVKLTNQLSEVQERERASENLLEREGREMEKMQAERMKLKEELTVLLSDNCSLRQENVKLTSHLQRAMDKFEVILGEKVDMENFTEALQGLHFLDKYKFESTVSQQQKLIDHLQNLYHEHANGKKKKSGKLFSSNKPSKDPKDPTSSLPLSWTDPQSALVAEKVKVSTLQGQNDKLREDNFTQANELLRLKTLCKGLDAETDAGAGERSSSELQRSSREGEPNRVQANFTVKLTQSAMEALSNPPGSQSRSKHDAQYSSEQDLKQGPLRGSMRGSQYDSQYSSQSLGASTMSLASNASSMSSSSSSSSSSSHRRRANDPTTPQHGSRRHKGTRGPSTPNTRGRPWKMAELPTPQRMRHNIPHRFATGMNTRATKCGLCLGSVHFVKQASKCQECGLVVHQKCASTVSANCGLPTEYMRRFEHVMEEIYREDSEQKAEIDQSLVKMMGWMKVPRTGKSGWENRWCVLEGTWLTLYFREEDANPVDSFDLDPMDAEVSVHSAVTAAELSNTATSDLHYVLRLDQDPLTTCWPGRYLYLMTTNFVEKQRWVASLEAVVKSAQCKSDLYRNRSQMLTVMSLKGEEQREFNCSLVISKELVLCGCEEGLYAFNPSEMTSKQQALTHISGLGSVHQMALARGVDLIVLLTGPERRMVLLDNKLVKCRMSQTLGGETTPVSFRTIEGLKSCTIFSVGLWGSASYLCVGTASKVYLMKYNPSLATYCVRKEFPSSEPCSCVCIAENYAIVGTERFYKISLEHPSMLDFVDRKQDDSLAYAAYGAANHKSYPLSVVRVSPEDLPLEFLLCFHEFGVFVDHHGQRTRMTDVKWSGLPLSFEFVEPFLYVTYSSTIHATVVPTDKSLARGRQTVIDVTSPRILGAAPSSGCIYISRSHNSITEVVRVKGQEGMAPESPNKENMGSSSSSSRSDKQVKWASPARVHRLRQNNSPTNSLSSLNSNTSAGTFASVESDV